MSFMVRQMNIRDCKIDIQIETTKNRYYKNERIIIRSFFIMFFSEFSIDLSYN